MKPEDPRHGTYNGYNNLKCRCDRCRKAGSERNRQWQQRRNEWRWRTGRARPREEYIASIEPAAHGTESRYNKHKCRCDECKAAANAARARRRRTPNVKVHNKNGYSNGCRCSVCLAGQNEYNRQRRARVKR